MSNPFTDVADFFIGIDKTIIDDITGLPKTVANWFGSLGGMIASGFEAGFVAIIKDLWNVILGPLEVFVGAVIIIFAIFVAVKDDLAGIGMAFGAVAK